MGVCECCLGYWQYVYGKILILCIYVLHYFPDCSQFDTGRWPSSINHSFVRSFSCVHNFMDSEVVNMSSTCTPFMRGNSLKIRPLQWLNQFWESLEEGAEKRCSE